MLEVKFIVINISIPTKPYAGIFSHPPLSAEASAPKPPCAEPKFLKTPCAASAPPHQIHPHPNPFTFLLHHNSLPLQPIGQMAVVPRLGKHAPSASPQNPNPLPPQQGFGCRRPCFGWSSNGKPTRDCAETEAVGFCECPTSGRLAHIGLYWYLSACRFGNWWCQWPPIAHQMRIILFCKIGFSQFKLIHYQIGKPN